MTTYTTFSQAHHGPRTTRWKNQLMGFTATTRCVAIFSPPRSLVLYRSQDISTVSRSHKTSSPRRPFITRSDASMCEMCDSKASRSLSLIFGFDEQTQSSTATRQSSSVGSGLATLPPLSHDREGGLHV